MKSWSPQHRVWLVALLPAALIALGLSSWHAHTRVAEIEAQALARTRSLARQFAVLAESDVRTSNRARLRSAVKAVQPNYPAITAVTIRGADGEPLVRAHLDRTSDGHPRTGAQSELVRIEQPIGSQNLLDEPADSSSTPSARSTTKPRAAIGQIILTVDLSAVHDRQAAMLLVSASLAGVTVLLALLVTMPIGTATGGSPISTARSRMRAVGALHDPLQDSPHARGIAANHDPEAVLARLRSDNARLDEARRAAEAASERKSRYLADVSHEIRTPMNAILGYTELLTGDGQRRHHADYVATIRDSIRNLLGLLNGVLDLSKVEAGRMELEYGDLDVNALLVEMSRLFTPQATAKGVELVVLPVAFGHSGVRADAMRLKQIVVNLVSNAIRSTSSGYVRISATASPRPPNRVGIRFMVEDSGCGIPESIQPRLFDAFAQGAPPGHHSGTGGSDGIQDLALDAGTGLGLSIASELVRLMGSRIEFRTESGKGSAFWFTLELDRPRAALPTFSPPAPRRRIALIDPTTIAREAHAAHLSRAGIDAEPMTAANWPAGARAAGRYDAIVVHIPAQTHTPDQIAPLDPRLAQAEAPTLALVHGHDDALRQALLRAGYHGIVAKTADPAALREAFERALIAEPEMAPSELPAPAPATGPRLLIVDDCMVNLELLRQYMSTAGFDVATATGSDEVLRQAAAEHFVAIVMDMHLPERDGAATARMLREDGGPNAQTPIIAVTADAFAEQAKHALRAGINDVLTKPVSCEALLARVGTWVDDWADTWVDETPEVNAEDEGRSIVDEAEATRRSAGKADLARELFAILCRSLPETRRVLARARADGDAQAAIAETHRLRGAVVYCGVPRLEAAVANLDRAARGGDAEALEQALARIESRIAEVLAHTAASTSNDAWKAVGGGSQPPV